MGTMNDSDSRAMASKVLPPNSSGIKVIVVGLGYAGVVAAVECYRKGHEVLVYEQTSKVSEGGGSQLIDLF
jgi:monoamine oxidase